MIRKILFLISALIIVSLAIIALVFQKNIKGTLPAIKSPEEPKPELLTEINTTGMPLRLPDGFKISIYAKDLGNPRVLAYDPVGNILAS
ncbi:MAG: Glucose/sorbosone dehydrogenase, partial [Candidatus Nomurabacteria bacterium GW2011_GWB1_37_5]